MSEKLLGYLFNKQTVLLSLYVLFKINVLLEYFNIDIRLQPQPQQGFQPWLIKALERQCLYVLHSIPSSYFADIYNNAGNDQCLSAPSMESR